MMVAVPSVAQFVLILQHNLLYGLALLLERQVLLRVKRLIILFHFLHVNGHGLVQVIQCRLLLPNFE